MARRTLYAALILNVALLGAYAWAASETTTIEIRVRGTRIVAGVNGYELAVDDSGEGGQIALYRAAPEVDRTYTQVGPAQDGLFGWAAALVGALRRQPLGTAWTRVTLLDGHGALLRDEVFARTNAAQWNGAEGGWSVSALGDYRPGREGYALLAADPGRDFTLRAELRRGITPAGVMIRAPHANNGLFLLVRPEDRDLQWFRLRGGQWGTAVAGGFFSKTIPALLQDILRVLLASQMAALALIALFLTISRALAYVSRFVSRRPEDSGLRRSFPCHSEPPRSGGEESPRPAENAEMLPYAQHDNDWPSHSDPHQSFPRHSDPQWSFPCHSEPQRSGGEESPQPAEDAEMLPYARRDVRGLRSRGPHRQAPRDKALFLALAIAFATTLVTAYIAFYVLEAMPHVQDDLTYLFQARVMAMGRLSVPASPQPEAFTQEFIVNHAGQAFGKYPPGYPLALLPGVLAGVPWLINPLQAGLAVLVIFFIARKVYSRNLALLAALLAASSPFLLFMSGSMMAHPTELLFILLFVLMYIKLHEPGAGARVALVAGLALGFAFITRPWSAVGIATPFALHAAYRLARTGGKDVRRLAPLFAGFVPFLLALLAYNWSLTGSPLTNPMELWWPFDRVGFGPGIGISGEHNLAVGLWNTYRNLTELTKHLYGWPASLTLAFVLLPFLTLRARRWDYLFLLGWLGLVLAQVAWWADGIMYGPRYYYETLGFLALLTARGAGILSAMLKGPLAPLLAVGLIAFNSVYYLPEQFALHQGYNYIAGDSLRLVAENGIHRAVVFVDTGQWFEWWNYGAVFPANTPTLDGDVVYARDRGAALNKRVIDLYPDRTYYRLSGRTVEEIKE